MMRRTARYSPLGAPPGSPLGGRVPGGPTFGVGGPLGAHLGPWKPWELGGWEAPWTLDPGGAPGPVGPRVQFARRFRIISCNSSSH